MRRAKRSKVTYNLKIVIHNIVLLISINWWGSTLHKDFITAEAVILPAQRLFFSTHRVEEIADKQASKQKHR